MRILAIDTSTAASAVAVIDGVRVLAEEDATSTEKHGQLLMGRIERVLQSAGLALAQLDGIGVGVGPGSFTGLRIGLATAKGLAFAVPLPIRGVSSLEVLAEAALEREEHAITLLDAFKGEVYAAAFRRGPQGPEPLGEVLHAVPAQAVAAVLACLPPGARALACGDGLRRYETELRTLLPASIELGPAALDTPRGRYVAWGAQRGFEQHGPSDLATLEPSYVRDSDARLPDRPLAL